MNKKDRPVTLSGVTDGVQIRMGLGNDTVYIDGSAVGLTFPGKLDIRTDGGDDTIWLDLLNVSGPARLTSGSGRDVVAIIDALLSNGLTARTQRGADDVALCSIMGEGRVKIRTGRASDLLTIDDSQLNGPVSLNTGAGSDSVQVERNGSANGATTTLGGPVKIKTKRGKDNIGIGIAGQPGNSARVRGCLKVHGGRKSDMLDAGLGGVPNSNGNTFECPPKVRGIENRPS